MTANPSSKSCTHCFAEKPLDAFLPSKHGKYGRRSVCRDCEYARHTAYRDQKRGGPSGRKDNSVFISEGIQVKPCTKCEAVKPLDAFPPYKAGKCGRAAECRVCSAVRQRAWKDRRNPKPAEVTSKPVKPLSQESIMLKQRRLPFRNFPPASPSKRVSRLMYPVRAWITDRVEAGAWQGRRAADLTRVLRRMCFDDALVCDDWCLELLYLETGSPHFRLYFQGLVFGVADIFAEGSDIGSSRHAPVVRCKLAAYLVALGWTIDRVEMREGGAAADIDEDTNHQYRLFKVAFNNQERGRVYSAYPDQIAI